MKINIKKISKKFLKWTGITLLVVIVLLILIPIFFKDQIKEMIIDEVNTSLNAELSLKDFDLTFISTFPNMTLELYDAKLTGVKEFKDIELISMKKMTAHVGFWSVVAGDQVEVDEIHLDGVGVDLRVLENGLANYDIVKPTEEKEKKEEESNFKLSLTEYSISNGTIAYNDSVSGILIEIENLLHKGKGDISSDVFDFETTTKMDKLTYRMDDINYLSEVKTDAAINMLMEFTEKSMKVTLKDNDIALNSVKLSLDGYYEMLENYDDMDLKLDASQTTFKDFLSLVPTFYQSGYESMVTSGDFKLGGELKGKMDDKNLPGWDFSMKLKNGSIKYADLPGTIRSVNVDAKTSFEGGENLDKMIVDLKKIHAGFSKNTIDASLFMNNLMSNPYIKSGIQANVDLSTLKDFVPLAEEESYSGILDADVDISGDMAALDREDYEAFTAKGVLELLDMNYTSPDLTKPVDISQMKFTFSPKELTLNELNAKMGNSDFAMNGDIKNYFGYVLRDEELEGDFNFKSGYLDLDELMNVYPVDEGADQTQSTSEQTTAAEAGPTLVPENINFALNTNIDKVKYNGIEAKSVNGDLRIQNEVAKLTDFDLNAMGGAIGLSGSYNTQDHKNPLFDFSYKLKNIDIHELTSNFLTVGKLAPIAKYAQGQISSNFTMHSSLDDNLMPVLNSITSDGDLSSNKLAITGFELLDKIESVTKLKDLSDQTFNNFKTRFSVEEGKVLLSPFNMKMGGMNTKVSGFTTLEKEMSYTFAMEVPKEKIPASVLKEVEKGVTLLNGLHPNISVGDLPAIIPANVFVKGGLKNPKVTTDLPQQIKLLMKDKLGNLVEDFTETVKDSIQTIVDDKVEDLKDDLAEQKQKILAEAKKQADKVRSEAQTAHANAIKLADKGYDETVKAAGNNPIKKKLAEVAAQKAREKAYKKADDTLAAANKKADDIEKKALDRANKLGE